jgi:hypothetical protein
LTGPIPDQEPEPVRALLQVHQQVPRLLHCPRPVRVRGHAQDMHMAGTEFEHEEHVDAAQGDRAVDMKEIARQHRGGGRDPQPLQHPPHCGRPDLDTEAQQLALKPLVSPARVLPRQLLDQHRDLDVDRRTATPAGIGPAPADQPPVPAQ